MLALRPMLVQRGLMPEVSMASSMAARVRSHAPRAKTSDETVGIVAADECAAQKAVDSAEFSDPAELSEATATRVSLAVPPTALSSSLSMDDDDGMELHPANHLILGRPQI